ncbi:YqcI/YcgG family protein [Priestia filamentosa]|uniref:YqcI/YcgG family protein n=1 Tax=Priestia filamentosa TaxID=1402861 RepID=UPI000E731F33|nr:YqcI/YcgG family protein [Priestia filamentosa]RJS63269.1 hypothetical protein CJ485_00435 [Priestia filamentosa]
MNIQYLYTPQQIHGSVVIPEWGKKAFAKFEREVLIENYPCQAAVDAFKDEMLYFTFVDSIYKYYSLKQFAEGIKHYVEKIAPQNKKTALIALFRERGPVQAIKEYERQFWDTVQYLHVVDEGGWPQHIAKTPNHPNWQFCFAGQPFSLICQTPAHEKRKSRYSPNFTIVFQPREILEEENEELRDFVTEVKKEVVAYDQISPHPALGWNTSQQQKEWRKYFLRDTNDTPVGQCPFRAKTEKIQSTRKGR